MTRFSQRDIRWRFKKLGFCSCNIGDYGCAITCLAMLSNKRPDEVNEILKAGGGFVSNCLVWWQKACNLLGLEWYGLSSTAKFYPTIMRVRMPKGEDHFVVAVSLNRIVDPLDGQEKNNPYPVVGYCLAKEKQVKVSQSVKPVENKNKYPATMKVVVSGLYVRKAPSRKAPLGGSKILRYGDKFTAIGEVRGERVSGNDLWYVSIYRNYVWSGGCKKV